MTGLACLTWNLHRCRGRDGIVDPIRTADTLLGILRRDPADLVVLTEAEAEDPPHGALLDMERIGAACGLASAHVDAALRWGEGSHGFLGTVVLHGPRLRALGGHLLDLPGHYPRGAAILMLGCEGRMFRIVATHLSLGQPLRIAQMRAIGQFLNRQPEMPTLLLGDLNEWRPWGGLAFAPGVVGRRFEGPARRSFPAVLPALPLDRIMAASPAKVVRAAAQTSPALRAVSDHLPLRAHVELG